VSTLSIPLTQGKVAVIDAEDWPELAQHKWHAKLCSGKWYAATRKGPRGACRVIYMHRLLLAAPDGQQVDHKDGDGLNNTRSNIRLATIQQNHWNVPQRKGGSSRFIGVYRDRSRNKWMARIRINYRAVNLGRFDDELAAARAYDEAARQRGEFAVLNFPDCEAA
jgi:hypothetical protein